MVHQQQSFHNSNEGVYLMPNKLFETLNQQVANFSVLYEKLHHYHWFVKGSDFFTLHEMFQKDYEEITELVDELAERLIQIGGVPVSTMVEYLKETTLVENQKEATSSDMMVRMLLSDYQHLVNELKNGTLTAAESEDKVTEDLFIGILTSLEKKIWLYKSFLNI